MPILDDSHDFAHPVGDDPAWNESWYFNAFAPEARAGFVSRIGMRPNAGSAHSLLVLWLPDGAVVQVHADCRATAVPDARLEVGGVRYERVAPLREWRVAARATATDGRAVELEAKFSAITPAVGIDAKTDTRDAARAASVQSLASGHLEQAGRWNGWIDVDGTRHALEGRGNRDKSWGPRKIDGSRGLRMWRWFSVNVGDDLHLGGLRLGTDTGDLHRGWISKRGAIASVRRWDVQTQVAPDGLTPRRIALAVTDKQGDVTRLDGEVVRIAALELPDAGGMRVLEGLTRWTHDGEEGWGIAEYAHLIGPDGRPAVAVE